MSDHKSESSVNRELWRAVQQGTVDKVSQLPHEMADPNYRDDSVCPFFMEELCNSGQLLVRIICLHPIFVLEHNSVDGSTWRGQ